MGKRHVSEDEFEKAVDEELLDDYEDESEKKRSLKLYHNARRRLDTLREDREMERLMKGESDVWDMDFY